MSGYDDKSNQVDCADGKTDVLGCGFNSRQETEFFRRAIHKLYVEDDTTERFKSSITSFRSWKSVRQTEDWHAFAEYASLNGKTIRTIARNEIPLAPDIFFQVSRVRCGLPIIQSIAWREELRSG
jgi:hypothetical protein